MTQIELVKQWQASANRNLQTAKDFFTSHHFDWSLFIGQLALEKLLKA